MAAIQMITCRCGRSSLKVESQPIISVECLCTSCREAGLRLQTLPGAPATLDSNGATRFELYRKDRVQCLKGSDLLKEYRLKPDSKTRRVVASCCNSPMFLEFTQGHWLSLYGGRWPEGSLPALDLRTMTGDLPPDQMLPNDVPNPKKHTMRFYRRLLMAWVAMRFRVPKITYISGSIDLSC